MRVGVAVGFAAMAATAWAAPPSRATDATEAMRFCGAVGDAPAAQQAEIAAQGLAAAERAVLADPDDATAHLAVFCNLGKQMRLSANPFGNLLRLRRLRREVDTALGLDPENADALVGKGLLLTRLPGFLGGDREEAEALLRHGLARDPDHVDGRMALAELLRARDPEAARVEARRALASAVRDGDAGDIADARTLLRSLGEDDLIAAEAADLRAQGHATGSPTVPAK
jgi:tetratricopeptide (TPR) repeat protein